MTEFIWNSDVPCLGLRWTKTQYYLETAPVYGVHGSRFGPDQSDIFTAALKNRPQLYYQHPDKPWNTSSRWEVQCRFGWEEKRQTIKCGEVLCCRMSNSYIVKVNTNIIKWKTIKGVSQVFHDEDLSNNYIFHPFSVNILTAFSSVRKTISNAAPLH